MTPLSELEFVEATPPRRRWSRFWVYVPPLPYGGRVARRRQRCRAADACTDSQPRHSRRGWREIHSSRLEQWPTPKQKLVWKTDETYVNKAAIIASMSGRGITAETIRRNTPQGIYTRLRSHASGRRSGDQFCVYVADRLVLPTLSQEDVAAIASGRHQMDAFVRRYVHENFSYRFVILPDAAAAFTVETAIKNGEWGHGRPLLNPGG